MTTNLTHARYRINGNKCLTGLKRLNVCIVHLKFAIKCPAQLGLF